MNSLITNAFLLLFLFIGMTIVLTTSNPIIDSSQSLMELQESEHELKIIDNYIQELKTEPTGSSRKITFSGISKEIKIDADTDQIITEYEMESEVIESGTRKQDGNFIRIGGSDVTCSNDTDLMMENSHLKVYFNEINCSSSNCLDTSLNIINMTQKDEDVFVDIVNSSIEINDVVLKGTGYSELLDIDENIPMCRVHFFVNSSKEYDVYYSLYSGSDFIDIQIKER